MGSLFDQKSCAEQGVATLCPKATSNFPKAQCKGQSGFVTGTGKVVTYYYASDDDVCDQIVVGDDVSDSSSSDSSDDTETLLEQGVGHRFKEDLDHFGHKIVKPFKPHHHDDSGSTDSDSSDDPEQKTACVPGSSYSSTGYAPCTYCQPCFETKSACTTTTDTICATQYMHTTQGDQCQQVAFIGTFCMAEEDGTGFGKCPSEYSVTCGASGQTYTSSCSGGGPPQVVPLTFKCKPSTETLLEQDVEEDVADESEMYFRNASQHLQSLQTPMVVNVFALIGLAFTMYGAFKHFTSESHDYNELTQLV